MRVEGEFSRALVERRSFEIGKCTRACTEPLETWLSPRVPQSLYRLTRETKSIPGICLNVMTHHPKYKVQVAVFFFRQSMPVGLKMTSPDIPPFVFERFSPKRPKCLSPALRMLQHAWPGSYASFEHIRIICMDLTMSHVKHVARNTTALRCVFFVAPTVFIVLWWRSATSCLFCLGFSLITVFPVSDRTTCLLACCGWNVCILHVSIIYQRAAFYQDRLSLVMYYQPRCHFVVE